MASGVVTVVDFPVLDASASGGGCGGGGGGGGGPPMGTWVRSVGGDFAD